MAHCWKGNDMTDRTKVPEHNETEVLVRSGRRCCYCYGLNGDASVKQHGQIAHLDHQPTNHDFDNLAYMCLDHHSEYDGGGKQSKHMTIPEAKRYRENLYHDLPNLTGGLRTSPGEFRIRDSKFNAVVENADEAYAMQVTEPAILENVEANLKVLGKSKIAAAFSTNQPLNSELLSCPKCSAWVPCVFTGKAPPLEVTCPKCGTSFPHTDREKET